MDAVYVYKQWPKDWLELRYSLRSLENIKHDDVYLVWYKPNRVKDVIHIEVEDKIWEKFNNVLNKLNIICEDKRISEDFIYMHDDLYILKEVEEIKYYSRWTLEKHCNVIKEKFWENPYYNAIKLVKDIYPDWLSYDLHCPIVFNKKKLKKILDKYKDYKWSKRSLYCNEYSVDWVDIWFDCKLFEDNQEIKDFEYLSSNNNVVNNVKFIEYLRDKFPKPSKYEYFNYLNQRPMKFISKKPFYNVSLSKLVRFNHLWEFETDDEQLIKELMNDTEVKIDWAKETTTKEKDKSPEPKTQWELANIITENDIVKLKEMYFEKFNKRPYHWWSVEQLQEKIGS